jgi:hypothetical protein
MFDYTWRCDCEAEGTEQYLLNAGRSARYHLNNECELKDPTVFIDQYDKRAGELSDRWWKVKRKATPQEVAA